MKALLNFLWTGQWCNHKWKTIEKQKVYNIEKKETLPRFIDYILECEKCGEISRRRL